MAFDKRRFEAVVLYIAHRRKDDMRFGRTKLAKALFYSDFEAYRIDRKPITGATYIRRPFGPFPRELYDAEESLAERGHVRLDHLVDQYEEKRIVPIGPMPGEALSLVGGAAGLIDIWTDEVASASAARISELSHKHFGWRMAKNDKDEIPYETALLPDRAPGPFLAQEAKDIARERGWLSDGGEWLWERELRSD